MWCYMTCFVANGCRWKHIWWIKCSQWVIIISFIYGIYCPKLNKSEACTQVCIHLNCIVDRTQPAVDQWPGLGISSYHTHVPAPTPARARDPAISCVRCWNGSARFSVSRMCLQMWHQYANCAQILQSKPAPATRESALILLTHTNHNKSGVLCISMVCWFNAFCVLKPFVLPLLLCQRDEM